MAASPAYRSALRFVVAIGVLSLFADIVYEGAHSINGQYLQSLGASAAVVGLVAGLGELAAYGLRFLSGRWADRSRAYWPITFLGYFLNLLAVPAMALAGNFWAAAALILCERAGKAVRNPARDAIFAHSATIVGEGKAWGIHEGLDELGAALGPAIVAGALWLRGDFRPAYAVLLLPAVVSLAILALARRIDPSRAAPAPAHAETATGTLGPAFWFLTAGAVLVAIGFADFSLVAYHLARTNVLGAASIPLLYGMANAVNAGGALVLGRLLDRWGRVVFLAAAVVQVASPLAFSVSAPLAVLGLVLWGLSVTVQQSLAKAVLTKLLGPHRRATGFGTYDGAWGVASLAGGLLLGVLYDHSRTWVVAISVLLLAAAVPLFWAATQASPRSSA